MLGGCSGQRKEVWRGCGARSLQTLLDQQVRDRLRDDYLQYLHREANKLRNFNSNFATRGEVWFSVSSVNICLYQVYLRTPFRWGGLPRRSCSPTTRWMETSSRNWTVLSGGHIVVCLYILFINISLFSLVSWVSLNERHFYENIILLSFLYRWSA